MTRPADAEHLAGLLAAKEAAFKALGCGWGDGVGWRDAVVERTNEGAPQLALTGAAAARAAAHGDVGPLLGQAKLLNGDLSGDMNNGMSMSVICSEDADLLVRMEQNYGVKLAFRADPNYHVENFKIVNAVTGEEYR